MRGGTLLKDLLGTVDNRAFELGRVLWAIGVLALIGYQGFAIWKGQPFSPIEFGTGFGALLVTGGFGVAAKDKARTEAVTAGVAE